MERGKGWKGGGDRHSGEARLGRIMVEVEVWQQRNEGGREG